MGKSLIGTYLLMHTGFLIYSCGLAFSKLAAQSDYFSTRFLAWVSLMSIFLMGFAIIWQQVLKRIPLSTALMNAEICLFWTTVIGFLFFREQITVRFLVGISLVALGVILVNRSDQRERP